MLNIEPDHLLEQAEFLVSATASWNPRDVDLRRAVSNAYYALFHTLLMLVADEFVGSRNRSSPQYALVYRSLDHRTFRELSEVVLKSSLPPKYQSQTPPGGFGEDIRAVASAFVDLQEKRYLADYAPHATMIASDAHQMIAQSRAAIARLKKANSSKKKAFAILAVFKPR